MSPKGCDTASHALAPPDLTSTSRRASITRRHVIAAGKEERMGLVLALLIGFLIAAVIDVAVHYATKKFDPFKGSF